MAGMGCRNIKSSVLPRRSVSEDGESAKGIQFPCTSDWCNGSLLGRALEEGEGIAELGWNSEDFFFFRC